MGGLLSLFKRRPLSAKPESPAWANVLPSPGATAPCLFSRNGEIVHTICKVEERQGTDLMLRVFKEIGKAPLSGLQVGSGGTLEIADRLLPLRVLLVQLPWIAVAAFPEEVRPAHRQFLRVPASFLVRFRRHGTDGPWLTGRGINVSTGGVCFASTSPASPASGTVYDTEVTLKLTRKEVETLEMAAEVRWVTTSAGETWMGLRVLDPARCKDLTTTVSRLQHLMARQPEDYVLVENQRPQLS
jgi:hypothetical protein